MRRRLLVGLIIICCIVLTVLFLPSLFRGPVSDILKKEINENLQANVSFSDADINLWRRFPQFTLTLDDFVIAGRNEFKGDTLVKMKELHIVLSTIDLLFYNQLEIRDLTLYDPQFHVLIHKGGRANFDIALDDADSSSVEKGNDIRMEIESCAIENGKFLFDDKSADFRLSGEELFMHGNGNLSGNTWQLQVAGETKKLSAVYQRTSYIARKDISLDLGFQYDKNSRVLKFSTNHAKINHLELSMQGEYQPGKQGHYIDMNFKSADSEFSDLLSLSSVLFKDFRKMKIEGHFGLEGFLKGTFNSKRNVYPSFRVDLKVNEGAIKYDELPKSINNIYFDLVAENKDSIADHTTLDLKTFRMKFGDDLCEGSLSIKGLKNGYIRSDINATLDLKELEKIYPVDSISLIGKLNFNLKAEGKFAGWISPKGQELNEWHTRQIPSFQLSMYLSDGSFKYDHLPESVNGINFHMKARNPTGLVDDTSIVIERLEARLGDNPLKGFIHLQHFKNPLVNAEIMANLDLSEMKNFLPLDGVDVSGHFGLDMKVSGQRNDSLNMFPLVDAKINLKNGFVRSDNYPAPIEKTHLILEAVNRTGHIRDTRFHIDTLTYTIEGESFFVEGVIEDLEKMNYDLALKGVLYLDKLNRILQLKDTEMAGEVDVDLKTSGSYDDLMAKRYHRLPTEGMVLLNDVVFQSPEIPHGLKIKQGHFLFTNEKITLDTLHGMIGESAFNISGQLTNFLAYALHNSEPIAGDLRFESDYFNLNELMRSEKPTRNDTSHHHLENLVIPDNIDFTFDTDISNLVYQNLMINDLHGEVTMKDGVLSLKETDFNTLEANFFIAGDYDTRDPLHPLFDLTVRIEDLDINKAHNAFVTVQAVAPAAEDTYGVFSIDYTLAGELLPNMFPMLESLGGGGTIRIRQARVNGMKLFHHISGITKKEELKNPELKDIVMETTVSSGVVTVKPFSMKLAGFETDIEGKHDLAGPMNYTLKIALPPFEIVKIPLHVNGTYDKPKIRLGKGHENVFQESISSSQ